MSASLGWSPVKRVIWCWWLWNWGWEVCPVLNYCRDAGAEDDFGDSRIYAYALAWACAGYTTATELLPKVRSYILVVVLAVLERQVENGKWYLMSVYCLLMVRKVIFRKENGKFRLTDWDVVRIITILYQNSFLLLCSNISTIGIGVATYD